MNRNIIQKTILDLQYNGSVDGIALQRSVSVWANEELLSILDIQLQKADKDGTLIKIDRLDIQIDLSEKEGMIEQLSKKINEQLSFVLKKVLEAKTPTISIESIQLSGSFAEEVLFFIEHGNLPWWSRINKQQDLLEQLLAFIDSEPGPGFINSLKNLVVNVNVQKRLVWQFPNAIFYRIIYWLAPSFQSYLPALTKEIDQIRPLVAQQEMRSIEGVFKDSVLASIEKQARNITADSIMRSFIEGLENAGLGSTIKEKINIVDTPVLKKYLTEAKNEPLRKRSVKKKEISGTSHLSKQAEGSNKELISIPASEGIYINNAGLVIIAGFLPHFFKRVGIINDNVITEKSKAACLVQFLASGNETIAEFDLGISKLLCGVEVDEAIETAIVLSDNEKGEANELLLSVIGHWNILGDTSVQGFRESFLMRKGKLWFENEEWHLLVEQKSYDMLLQQLPWSFNIIRLPWMQYPLRTGWAY